jgi:hypothetical protein
MNKARRQELKQLKYKRRLKMYGFASAETLANPKGHNYNFTGYKTSGRPCSCLFCQKGTRYNRAKVKQELDQQL